MLPDCTAKAGAVKGPGLSLWRNDSSGILTLDISGAIANDGFIVYL